MKGAEKRLITLRFATTAEERFAGIVLKAAGIIPKLKEELYARIVGAKFQAGRLSLKTSLFLQKLVGRILA